MKFFKTIVIILLPVSFLVGAWTGMKKTTKADDSAPTTEAVTEEVNESELLINYLEANGDFINTPDIESATSVLAEEVFAHLGNKKYHIIDLRAEADFYPAHIPGSIQVEANNLFYYMKSIPVDYIDKIVLVCYAGQKASYNTGLLRLLGYDNVYFMKYGMSAWSKEIANENWVKNVSNSYAGKMIAPLESLPEKGEMPSLYTMKTTGREILETRIMDLMQEDYSYVKVKADELMASTSNFFIMLYEPKFVDKNIQCIEGSYIFSPGSSLKFSGDLKSIPPADIIVTSLNGQTSAIVTAYLRALGFDARFLVYGLNALEINELKRKNAEVFSPSDVKGFGTVSKKAPIRAAKPVKSGGGC